MKKYKKIYKHIKEFLDYEIPTTRKQLEEHKKLGVWEEVFRDQVQLDCWVFFLENILEEAKTK